MNKGECKLILNFNLSDEELEEKVRIAVDDYIQKVTEREIDKRIEDILNARINYLFGKGSSYKGYSYAGNQITRQLEKAIDDNIDDAITQLIAKRLNFIMKQAAGVPTGIGDLATSDQQIRY